MCVQGQAQHPLLLTPDSAARFLWLCWHFLLAPLPTVGIGVCVIEKDGAAASRLPATFPLAAWAGWGQGTQAGADTCVGRGGEGGDQRGRDPKSISISISRDEAPRCERIGD